MRELFKNDWFNLGAVVLTFIGSLVAFGWGMLIVSLYFIGWAILKVNES